MTKTHLNPTIQQRRVLMRKLNGMVQMRNQDPDEYLTKVLQQRGELEHIGESFTEARITDLIQEGLSNEHEPIRLAFERDPEISLKRIRITIRNMYANGVTRGGGSTFRTSQL